MKLNRYLPFFILQIVANVLWAFWALPDIGEQGSLVQDVQWMAMQVLLPLLFCVLIARQKRYVRWLLSAYGFLMALFGFGTVGWALMGVGTPVSVYVVCVLYLVVGFCVFLQAMRDLEIASKRKEYRSYEDE